MDNLFLKRKLKIGISACMFGAKTRYNGKGYDMIGEIKREKTNYYWDPVCPEVMSGMGVPRNPIRLSGGNGHDFWEGNARIKNRNGEDVTDMVRAGAISCYETLERAKIDAFIFMEGSPSCGVYRTTLKNSRMGNPPGVFGALLLDKGYFLIPAQDLSSPIKWWDWRRRLNAFVWCKEHKLESLEDINNMWKTVKYLCKELSTEDAKHFEHLVHSFSSHTEASKFEKFRGDILNLLRKPSDVEHIKKTMWESYKWLKKNSGVDIPDVMPPEGLRNMTHIAEELLHIEIEARKHELFFGSSPIIYKPER